MAYSPDGSLDNFEDISGGIIQNYYLPVFTSTQGKNMLAVKYSKCETYMKIIKLFGVIPMYNGLTYFPKENDSLDVQTFTTMLFLFLSSLWESSCLCQLLLMFVLLVY